MEPVAQPLPQAPARAGRPIWIGLLIGCGALSMVGCCILISLFGWGLFTLRDALPEAKSFLKKALPAVAQPWDAEQMRRRSATGDFNSTANWEKLFKIYRAKLGSLEAIDVDEPSGWYLKNLNGRVYVELRYSATFEKAEGTMTLVLRKQDNDWEFWRININSPAFDTGF